MYFSNSKVMNIKTKFQEEDTYKQRLERLVLMLCLVTRATSSCSQQTDITECDDLSLDVLKLVVRYVYSEKCQFCSWCDNTNNLKGCEYCFTHYCSDCKDHIAECSECGKIYCTTCEHVSCISCEHHRSEQFLCPHCPVSAIGVKSGGKEFDMCWPCLEFDIESDRTLYCPICQTFIDVENDQHEHEVLDMSQSLMELKKYYV